MSRKRRESTNVQPPPPYQPFDHGPPSESPPGTPLCIPAVTQAKPLPPPPTILQPRSRLALMGPPVQTRPPAADLDAMDVATLGRRYRNQLLTQCEMGNHETTTRYRVFGIVSAAMVCFPCVPFPWGLVCIFADTEEECAICGVDSEKR